MEAIILGILAVVCLAVSYLQLKEKGVLLNNVYIFASKEERKTIDKKPHYRQSGIVFLLLGIICLIEAIHVALQIKWLFYCTIALAVVLMAYAVISTVRLEMRKK